MPERVLRLAVILPYAENNAKAIDAACAFIACDDANMAAAGEPAALPVWKETAKAGVKLDCRLYKIYENETEYIGAPASLPRLWPAGGWLGG